MRPRKKNRPNRPPSRGPRGVPYESKSAETITVAWTVMLTTVLLCDLATLLAHLYVASHPQARLMDMLSQLLLFAGAIVGILLIGLLPVLNRVRRVDPPPGLVGFGVLIAIAPILTLLAQILG